MKMKIRKPDLVDLRESVQVLFYSVWSILYYIVVWFKKNVHRFIHIVWLLSFSFIYSINLNIVWMWVGTIPAIIYAILWAILLRRVFDASIN